MEQYGFKARVFTYRGKQGSQIEEFVSNAGLNVLVINIQAFTLSLNPDGTNKENRTIHSRNEKYNNQALSELLAYSNPILIIDEPQRTEGTATQNGIRSLNPLFILSYSATHKTRHNTIYALDALDAYQQKLVKRIQVKGFELKNLSGTQGFLYLDNIVLSPKHPPQAQIELETRTASGTIRRKIKTFNTNDDLYAASGLPQHKGLVIAEIRPEGVVRFLNGMTLKRGEVRGGSKQLELELQRIQIRETIVSHLEKERQLFWRGIKCLSLFFIDEVAHYKSYDSNGNEQKGYLQDIFEEEYQRLVQSELQQGQDEYTDYLAKKSAGQVHRGYFSIDKKTRHVVNSKVERTSGLSDDISAYELILKNKERLLSFEEPTRFIFTHSALREGWDNPNVFQICTLRHANSTIAKRQEVGRGLRLCVDQNGIRMDAEELGDEVHAVNRLTVIANESYVDFTTGLQRETQEALRERIEKASIGYFTGKKVHTETGAHTINEMEACHIMTYLNDNGYIDDSGQLTTQFHDAAANGVMAPLPDKLQPISQGIFALIHSILDPKALCDMVVPEKTSTPHNRLNSNFQKFQTLWEEINHKYIYKVDYDSQQLTEQAIALIDSELEINGLRYVMIEGSQDKEQVTRFSPTRSHSGLIDGTYNSSTPYDLVDEIAKGARLTRRTALNILQGIRDEKLALFRRNPEDFINKTTRLIKRIKGRLIKEHIQYYITEGKYDSSIFTQNSKVEFDRAYPADKHICDYVFTDSQKEVEFTHDLDMADEVVVFAKLPRSYQIPTPVGQYTPDWAIAMKKNGIKHIFFIAETKGTQDPDDLTSIENIKIECAKRLFNSASTSKVRYHQVSSYEELRNELSDLA